MFLIQAKEGLENLAWVGEWFDELPDDLKTVYSNWVQKANIAIAQGGAIKPLRQKPAVLFAGEFLWAL